MPQKIQTRGNRAAPARVAAAATTLFGLVALSGWAFHIPLLTRVLPGAVEMKFNTAVAVVLCGAALLILADRAAASKGRAAPVRPWSISCPTRTISAVGSIEFSTYSIASLLAGCEAGVRDVSAGLGR